MNGTNQESGRVLVVDDNDMNLCIATDLITPMGLEVTVAHNGEEALRKIAEVPPDIILLDVMMPGLNGYEVCGRIKKDPKTQHIPVIMLTALDGVDDELDALHAGADDFMNKPFNRAIMEVRLKRLLKEKRLQEEINSYQKNLEKRVRQQTTVIQRVQDVITHALARFAEYRDPETGAHLERIRHYCAVMAARVPSRGATAEMEEDYVSSIYRASILHDMGKVAIKDEILLKPGKLTPEEFETMKTHSVIGGDLLDEALRGLKKDQSEQGFLQMAVDIAYHHHEKFDGSGYPYGKKGDEIPLSARIVAVADVYDALTSRRPYKEPFPIEKALGIVLEGRGTHFDPDVLDCFEANFEAITEISRRFEDEASGNVSA